MKIDNDVLQEQNFVNLVEFYRDELMLVLKGGFVVKVFSERECVKLRNVEILSYRNGLWFLTQTVKDILK